MYFFRINQAVSREDEFKVAIFEEGLYNKINFESGVIV